MNERMRMKKQKAGPLLAVLLCLILLGGGIIAALAMSSDNYSVGWSVLSSGGGPAGSDNYNTRSSITQTGIGPSSSDNYLSGSGYWYRGVKPAPGPATPPAPTVVKPNGGEEIPGDSIYDIKWSVTKGTYDLAANPITIWYSTNNGGSWTQVATNEPNDGRYSWNVPNINPSSSNCVVKVEVKDVQGNKGDDTSDATFTITKTSSSETETIPAGGTGTVEGPPESDTSAKDECAGSPFGSGGFSSPVPVPEFSLMGLVVLVGVVAVVLATMVLRRKE